MSHACSISHRIEAAMLASIQDRRRRCTCNSLNLLREVYSSRYLLKVFSYLYPTAGVSDHCCIKVGNACIRASLVQHLPHSLYLLTAPHHHQPFLLTNSEPSFAPLTPTMPGPTATASTSTIILDPSNPSHKTLFPTALADVHIACISTDKTIATFLPPLSRSKIAKWYEDRFREVESGSRVMVMEWLPSSFASAPDSTPTIEGKEEEQEVVTWEGRELAGSVMLATRRGPDGELTTQTGPFRGDVLNLLVSPRFRRRGVARRIMERLEVEARRVGVGLLVRLIFSFL